MNDERLVPMLEHYAQTRDPALRDALVEGYLPLARAVARKFAGRGAEMEDLEQVASIALLKAIDRFEVIEREDKSDPRSKIVYIRDLEM